MSKTNSLRRLKKALDSKYETQQMSPVAGAVGERKMYIGGQLYDGALDGVAQVVNTGRPAAAQYAAKAGGQVVVRSSGGGGGTTTGGGGTDVTALSLLTVVAESALTSDRYLDVATGLTKTDGGAGGALTLGLNTPGTLTVSSTNTATGNHTHAITSSSAPGAAASLLASSAAGLLTLPNFTATTSMRTPLIDTASGALTLQPAGTITALAATIVKLNSTTALDIENASGTSIFTVNTTTPGATMAGTLGVTGALTGSSTAAFTGTVTTPTVSTASGNLTLTSVGGTVAVTGALTVSSTATITGVTSIASGSVGAPGLTFTGDTNTGIYRSGTDAYSLVAGGAAIINVGATGAGVNAAYDSTAALKVQSVANDDITLFLKQKSGQTARMWRVEDSAGQELIVLDSQGNLQSGNPGFVSGLTGWQITPTGTAEFNNVWVRGELHASIFVMDEFHASGGTLYIAPAGKLELDATIYTTTGVEAILDIRTTSVSGSGSQLDIRTTSGAGSGTQITSRWIENYFEITDPPSGHAMILAASDIVRCKALGLGVGIDLWDVWGVISRVEDMTDYYRYYYERKSGGTNGLIIPAGTAIISYGAPGDGRIYLTADQNYAPYMQVFLTGVEPWNGDIRPTTRIGRLDGVGLPGVSGIEQYGMVTSTDLSDATAPYIVNSNLQMFSYNVDSEWNNGNPTARITSGGSFKLGIDIDNASTTGLEFNPTTGALTIGSASYPGTVTVYGSITVTGGNAAKTDFSNITATIDNVPNGATYSRTTPNQVTGAGRAYTALSSGNNLVTSVIPATAIGNPGVAGLYLGSDYMGYHTGNGASTGWKTYMDSSGNFRFAGSSATNYIQWAAASNKLQGVGGGVEQWYADATDGRLKFGGGNGFLDADGLTLLANGNPTARIANGGSFKLGTNIASSTTTALDFNGATGALTIGSASYPGTVTVYGNITVTSGSSGYANFGDRPTSLSGINTTEGTKLNAGLDTNGSLITKVLPGSTIGTPAGAGLFLGSDKMGYYNGSRWLTYMDSTGAFTFSSATTAKIAWDGTDLYGTDGTNAQWYARASTGKLYAGNGAVVLDRTGILVANDATSAGITLHRTNAFTSSTKSGRLWALSDLSPARVYFSAGRSVNDDGDASNAAGIMDIVAYSSSGTAAAMLSLSGNGGAITVTGDLDMAGGDIIDANNIISIRTTA